MSKREIVVLTDVALITAIVQRGTADEIVKAAQEAGRKVPASIMPVDAGYANAWVSWV